MASPNACTQGTIVDPVLLRMASNNPALPVAAPRLAETPALAAARQAAAAAAAESPPAALSEVRRKKKANPTINYCCSAREEGQSCPVRAAEPGAAVFTVNPAVLARA